MSSPSAGDPFRQLHECQDFDRLIPVKDPEAVPAAKPRRGRPKARPVPLTFPSWHTDPRKQQLREWVAVNAWIDWLVGRPFDAESAQLDHLSAQAAVKEFADGLAFAAPGVT